jgi:hypothetical protein
VSITRKVAVGGAAVVATTLAVSAGAAPAVGTPIFIPRPAATVSYEVYDRPTGQTLAESEGHRQYRSASVVKLLIALDYFESHGPNYQMPPADATRMQAMLRSSDDDAASYFWVQDGWQAIVQRMVARIGLTDTAPPASAGMWGYTAISAADIVKIYNYILGTTNPAYRDFIMGNLRQSTRCGNDGFDQSFGIPTALARPWAVKQGWSGFGASPAAGHVCSPANAAATSRAAGGTRAAHAGDGVAGWSSSAATTQATPNIDLSSPVMHTTGTVGPNDDRIVVVLALDPAGTSWDVSASWITSLTGTIYRDATTDCGTGGCGVRPGG